MGTYTTNLNLEKPSDADTADIAVINGNMDVLDGVIGDVDTATDGDLQTQIKTLGDSVGQKVSKGAANVSFNVPSATSQCLHIGFVCKTVGSAYYDHSMTFSINSGGMLLWDNTAGSVVWSK